MKELLLIPIMLAAFVFCYFLMAKLDRFMDDNQRLIAEENRNLQSKVRIAAESPLLLESVAKALESCSNANPHLAFFLSSGKASRLLEKLMDDRVDIVLLTDEEEKQMDARCAFLRIPYEKAGVQADVLGLPVEDLDEASHIRVVWNKAVKAKDRDRVIFALENEHCRLKCGYADYLD